VSVYWWLGEWHYLKFILRELSSVAVAMAVVEMLLLFRALGQGPEAYERYLSCMRNPWVVICNVVAMLFVLFHTITWFNLAPSAMPVRLGGKRVPDILVAAPSYVAWVVVSLIVGWLILR
jgi:fumarate reductase subunit C